MAERREGDDHNGDHETVQLIAGATTTIMNTILMCWEGLRMQRDGRRGSRGRRLASGTTATGMMFAFFVETESHSSMEVAITLDSQKANEALRTELETSW